VSGRPRDPAIDGAITTAALDVLAEEGWDGLTLGEVAKRAGVSRPTVYRRHGSRAELAASAIEAALGSANQVAPDTGDVAEDLYVLLRNTARLLSRTRFGVAVAELIAPCRRDPELRAAADDALEARRTLLRGLLERAREEERLAMDVELAADLLLGAIYYRHLVTGAPLGPRFLKPLVAAVVS